MDMVLALLSAIIAYLIGSISFARLVTRWWASGKDITAHEIMVDGTQERYKVLSIGANSASSVLGARGGMVVSLLDILKVFLPTLFFKLYFPDQPACWLAAAAAGMAGHIWPVFYRFHGGSGFSAIMGGLLAIDWLAVLVTPVAGLLLGMVVFRNMIVASLSWIWLLIPWLWWRTGGDLAHILYALAVNILFLLAMVPEYRTAMKYKKEGKYIEYGLGNLKSNPMGRGMLKIARFFRVEIK
jgi:acyl phosphate:glycerol-3-phosphate acyltransferase